MRLSRVFSALVGLGLVLSATLTGTAAVAGPGDGTLVVKLVDFQGKPDAGQIQVIGPAGVLYTGGESPGASTLTAELPARDYGAFGMTPWGGFTCVGLAGCDYLSLVSGKSLPNGDLSVVAGDTTTVTIKADRPATIGGSRIVGEPLEIDYSDGLDSLLDLFGSAVGPVAPRVQWLRDGAPIAGADETTYEPTGADTGKAISARLAYAGTGLSYMQQLTGAIDIPEVTTPAVTVRKRSSETFIRLVRGTITAGQQPVVRVDVTAPGEIVTGKVTIAIGSWKATRTLRNGRAVVEGPALSPGTYTVTASYQGSGAYAGSKAKPKKLTVTKK